MGLLLWVLAEDAADAGPAPVIAAELTRLIVDYVHVLVTTSTRGALPKTVAEEVLHVAAPAGNSDACERFLEHWRPDFGVVIGRPQASQLVQRACARGMPLFHAAVSREAGGQHRYPAYLQDFHTCLSASASEASALRQQFRGKGAAIEITGPLSDTVHAPGCNEADCDEIARLLGGRPVWLAAGIGRDEVAMIEAAHRKAYRSAHRLLLLLAPNDPGDAAGIAEGLEAEGWQVGLRSRGDEPDSEVQIYVADTVGELGLWYRLAPSTFVGGTFLPNSVTSDPFHPAALGSAVLHGPYTGRNPARFERLAAQGASVLVRNAEELGEAVITLLSPDKAASLAQAGWATTTESAHVVARLAELMQAVLEAREESV
ncbi:MAG: hypothetical protein KJN93_03085 [Alphaproteobacteria bacterium]|nr:hypothetical protein [Alphaproteobacteria bacterium]